MGDKTRKTSESGANGSSSGAKAKGKAKGDSGRGGGATDELQVCQIMGEWGLYQWSLVMFAVVYWALSGATAVFEPMLTPDLAYICDNSLDLASSDNSSTMAQLEVGDSSDQSQTPMIGPNGLDATHSVNWANFTLPPHECTAIRAGQTIKCNRFIYDYKDHGEMLTNHFDLVCDREWLRSLASSASLAGMLISSVTIGLFSDKYGRLRCAQLGFTISILANVVALFAQNYYLFCACVFLMTFGHVGGANACSTMVMESTSPRMRFLPIAVSAGWAIGTASVPLIHSLTKDYRLFMGVILVVQLLMLPWLKWGIFESIRWLLSEGHINKAQIELRRACRMNRVETGAKLAQEINLIQVQQVRKASRIMDSELAPKRLAQAMDSDLSVATQELDMLNAAIKQSFKLIGKPPREPDTKPTVGEAPTSESHQLSLNGPPERRPSFCFAGEILSPTLAKKSFSLGVGRSPPLVVVEDADKEAEAAANSQPAPDKTMAPSLDSNITINNNINNINNSNSNSNNSNNDNHRKSSTQAQQNEVDSQQMDTDQHRPSYTAQAIIQLAMKYSITVQEAEEGRFFLTQMCHKKLWSQTLILGLVSVMYESSYYGFVQANKMVGKSTEMNYVLGGVSELLASLAAAFMAIFYSRKASLISTTFLGAICLLTMAATYHFIPMDTSRVGQIELTPRQFGQTLELAKDQIDSEVIESSSLLLDKLNSTESNSTALNLMETLIEQPMGMEHDSMATIVGQHRVATIDLDALRQWLNMALMLVGKFVVCVGIEIIGLIAMECYPNNLRQTGPGALKFVARICSIIVPFLFNDRSESKAVLKLTLVSLGSIGLLVCLLVPCILRDNKDKELCDRLNEIED